MGKLSRIRCQAVISSSARKGCFEISMAVCGLQLATGVSCMYTAEGRMCSSSLTAFQVIGLHLSLRIEKALFGQLALTVSTAFASLPSPQFRWTKVYRAPASCPYLRKGTEALGSGRPGAWTGGTMGELPFHAPEAQSEMANSTEKYRMLSFRIVGGELGFPRDAGSATCRRTHSLP